MKAESESSASSSAFEAESTIPSVHTGDYSSLDVASKRRFKSYRLRGEYEKPWLSDPAMYKTKWNNWIVRAFIVLGFMLAGVACYFMVAPYKDGAVSRDGSFPIVPPPASLPPHLCFLPKQAKAGFLVSYRPLVTAYFESS